VCEKKPGWKILSQKNFLKKKGLKKKKKKKKKNRKTQFNCFPLKISKVSFTPLI